MTPALLYPLLTLAVAGVVWAALWALGSVLAWWADLTTEDGDRE
jgi:hypothetical protein